MIKNIYSVRDTKASSFSAPFIAENEIIAVRMLTGALQGEQTLLSQFPADFELFQIATFNITTGQFTSLEPKFIISCASIMLNILRTQSMPNLSKSALTKESEAPVSPDSPQTA